MLSTDTTTIGQRTTKRKCLRPRNATHLITVWKIASYKIHQKGKLKQLKTKNPKEFLKILSSKEKAHQVKVAPDDFFTDIFMICICKQKRMRVTV